MGIELYFNASAKEQMTPAARRKLLSALQSLPALSGLAVKPLKLDSDPCVFASVVVDGTRDSVKEIWKALVDWAKASKTLIELPQSGTIVDLKRPGLVPLDFDGPVQDHSPTGKMVG